MGRYSPETIMLRPIVLARLFFVLLATACGYWVSYKQGQGPNTAILAFILSLIIVLFEYSMRTLSVKKLLLASLGLLFGLVVALMVYETIPESIMSRINARITCNFFFGYLGIMVALKHADQVNLSSLKFILSNPDAGMPRLLDTSVIIDGRIKDMILAGFIQGNVIVPTFVINELQQLADSSDSLKRVKGRRGLGILEDLQNEFPDLQISEKDYPDAHDVDHKLLDMAKEFEAQVVTNDYNLQKVASLYKVPVLNLNELTDMLKPSVYVGEAFSLTITREGKESNQGVGYLKDGTMVVVDDGIKYVGQNIDIMVTSILQTNTGRMVFARPVLGNGSKNDSAIVFDNA
jgi:uncharacterized protein YacL